MFAAKRRNKVLKSKQRTHASVSYHPFSQTERWVWLWCQAPAATRPWQSAPTGSPRSSGSQSHGPGSRAHAAGIPEGWSSPGWDHCSHSSCSGSQSPSGPERPARWALCPAQRSARQTRRHQRTYHLRLWTKKNSDTLVSPEKHSQCHFSADRLICKQHSQPWSDSREKKRKRTERKRESPLNTSFLRRFKQWTAMKCTDRKNGVVQKGWLATGMTQKRFLAFLPAILKFVFNYKFLPSRPIVIRSSTGILHLQWKGVGVLDIC